MARAYLTRRALRDIDEIDRYSTERWGDKVAEQYLAVLFAAVERLGELPSLLQRNEDYSARLRFYRARDHVLVCDVVDEDIYILAIRHTKMDLPRRIAELEPLLLHEAEFFHDRIVASRT